MSIRKLSQVGIPITGLFPEYPGEVVVDSFYFSVNTRDNSLTDLDKRGRLEIADHNVNSHQAVVGSDKGLF